VIDTIAGPDILINGITVDPNDNIYFATGEFALLFPKKGMIKKISCKNSCSEPEIIVDNCKRPNGLFFDTTAGRLFFTETLNGVRSFNTMTKTKNNIIKNKRLFDASDDLCIDKSGGIWIANPPNGFVKYYKPGKERITYFKSKYFGAASACRIRWEKGEEILYISEIRNPKGEYNGRGLISIPVEVLKNIQ
jgi:sugar lactone lactonase YvrE